MKSRKVISMMMALLLMSTGLVGCGKADQDSSKNVAQEEAKVTVDEDGREMVGNMYVEGLPIVKEKESFTIFVDGGSVDYSNSEFLKMLEEQTNVHVEIMSYPYEVSVEKKNILLNSGEYPDTMGGWILSDTEIMRYGSKEEIFVPIDGLIEKYAPKIQEVLELDGVRSAMTLPDGHIYTLPYVVPEPEVVFGPWINQAWLDKLGLEMPTTIDEFYEVLVAFKNGDPNGNGKKDEIPLSMRADHMYNIFSWFGYPEGIYFVDGEPTYTATLDYYKEGIKFLNKLYEEGLLDVEVFTQDMSQFEAKGKEVDALYGAAIIYYPYTFGEERMDDYVPIPPLQSNTGLKPTWRRGSLGVTTFRSQFVITDNAANPATIIRWFDNLYQIDNSIQAANGLYGVALEKTADGYKLLDNEKTKDADYMGSQYPGSLPRYIPAEESDRMEKSEVAKKYQAQTDAMDATYANNFAEFNPPIWLTEEERKSIATIETDIGQYVKDKRAAWISGQADVEAEWDEFQAQLDKLGLSTMMEVYSKAMKDAASKQ